MTRAPLPAWPFTALFVAYPLWWLLGLAPFAVFGMGACATALMVARGGIRLPRMWWWWLAFVLWGLASTTMIDTAGRMVGFAQRWAALTGALALVVYVYNAPERLPRHIVLGSLSAFLGWTAIGGYLGMAFPAGRVSTPISMVLPAGLAANPYVHELLNPRFAEVQQPWGATEAFVRPSAPFPYTNAWGQACVLLLPVAAAMAVKASRRGRLILLALVVVTVPPALATLNRGVFIGVGLSVLYLALRRVRHLNLSRVLTAAAVLTAGAVAVAAGGVLERLTDRTSSSSTTQDRADLYREAFQRTLASPWVGWGAPRPSETKQVSVGTQGHLWYLMFSHGFVGLALFLIAMWGTAVATRRVCTLQDTLVHTPVVLLGVTLTFYGVDGLHLLISLTCAVLLSRPEPRRLTWGLIPRDHPAATARGPSRAGYAVSMGAP